MRSMLVDTAHSMSAMQLFLTTLPFAMSHRWGDDKTLPPRPSCAAGGAVVRSVDRGHVAAFAIAWLRSSFPHGYAHAVFLFR